MGGPGRPLVILQLCRSFVSADSFTCSILITETTEATMSKLLMKGEGGEKAELRRRIEVRKYFNKADKNGDGKLTKEEWHQVLNQSGVPTSM